MISDGPAAGVAHALVIAAVLLTATACTSLDALAPPSDVSASADDSKPPRPAVSSGDGSPGQTKGEGKTFSAESIHVLSQKTVTRETGSFVEMTIEAPAQTRFLVGSGDNADTAVPCDDEPMDGQAVLYRVHCPSHGAGDKTLLSITSDGEFEYGFSQILK